MDTWITTHEDTETEDAFRTALVENVDMIVDALHVVGHELAATGDARPAEFFEQIAGVLSAFLATWAAGHESLRATSPTRPSNSIALELRN